MTGFSILAALQKDCSPGIWPQIYQQTQAPWTEILYHQFLNLNGTNSYNIAFLNWQISIGYSKSPAAFWQASDYVDSVYFRPLSGHWIGISRVLTICCHSCLNQDFVNLDIF